MVISHKDTKNMESGESEGLFSFYISSARADAGGFGSVPQIAARRALG